jgi:hypothetical protein
MDAANENQTLTRGAVLERPMPCTTIAIITAIMGVMVGGALGAFALAITVAGKTPDEDDSHKPPTA